jgi:hypothetical protein
MLIVAILLLIREVMGVTLGAETALAEVTVVFLSPFRKTSRLPHFIDGRLTDDSKIVRLTSRPTFTPKKIPGTHFR